MRPKQGDIWLVPIPFTDLTASKRRPVLILSNDGYHQRHADCVVMAITSHVERHSAYGLLFSSKDLAEGLLPKESQLRADKVYAVSQSILIHKFGRLADPKYRAATALLEELIHRA